MCKRWDRPTQKKNKKPLSSPSLFFVFHHLCKLLNNCVNKLVDLLHNIYDADFFNSHRANSTNVEHSIHIYDAQKFCRRSKKIKAMKRKRRSGSKLPVRKKRKVMPRKRFVSICIKNEEEETNQLYFVRIDIDENVRILERFRNAVRAADIEDIVRIPFFDGQTKCIYAEREITRTVSNLAREFPAIFMGFMPVIKDGTLTGKLGEILVQRVALEEGGGEEEASDYFMSIIQIDDQKAPLQQEFITLL